MFIFLFITQVFFLVLKNMRHIILEN